MPQDVTALTVEELLEHAEWVRRIALSLVRDPDEAGDLAQEAWEVALAKPPREPGPLRPWLSGVVRNLYRMRARTRSRRERREEAAAPREESPMPSPEALVERVQTQQLVARSVLELGEPLRSTVLLRYYEGLSAAEIARRLDIPAGTVRWRLKRGLDTLRGALDRSTGDRQRWVRLLAPLAAAREAAPAGASTTTAAASTAAAAKGLLAMKTAAKIAAAAAALLLLWFGGRQAGLWGGEEETRAAKSAGAESEVAEATAPRGPSVPPPRLAGGQSVSFEDDPDGRLRLEGQVIDVDEQPVGGASVAIDTNPPRTVTAEGDGSFAFTGLIGRRYSVEARADDRYAGPVHLRLSDTTEPVILRVRTAGALQIEVVNAAGAPISGAEVELRSSLTWTATTGEDGAAALLGVREGSLPLHVRAAGYAPVARRIRVAADPDVAQRERVILRRGAPVSGRVLGADGEPVFGARVTARSTSEPFPVIDPRRDGVTTGRDGRFALDAIAAGTYRFTATHASHASATTAPMVLDGEHAREGIELTLRGGGVIAGRVLSESGEAVAGADVRAVAGGSVEWRQARRAYTDARGRFRLTALPRRDIDLVASSEGGSSEIATLDLASEAEAKVDLTLSIRGAIEGVVEDESGEAIPEARILAEPEWSGDVGERSAWDVRGIELGVADAGGRFRFSGLPGGSYRLRAARPGAAQDALWLARGEVARTGDRHVRLLAPRGGRVRGKVVYEDGTAPELFTIAIGPASPVPLAPEDGAFELEAPGGTHNVIIAGPSIVRHLVEAEIEGDELTDLGTITVDRGRSLSGRVLDSGGAPVSGAEVAAGSLLTGDGSKLFIEDESIGARTSRTDVDGRFFFDGFDEGSLVLVAGKSGVGRSDSIRIPPGPASAELDLVLEETGGLEGSITRDNAPVAETVVIANPVGATSSNFFVVTGQDGSFAFDALAAGEYLVYPMLGGGGGRPKDMFMRPVKVIAGERAKLDIPIESGDVALELAVETESGDPVGAAQVLLLGLEIEAPTMSGLRDGRWLQHRPEGERPIAFYLRTALGSPARIEGLTSGRYTACAVPLPADPRNPLVAQRLRQQMETLPMTCAPLEVTPSPAKQAAAVRVPADPATDEN